PVSLSLIRQDSRRRGGAVGKCGGGRGRCRAAGYRRHTTGYSQSSEAALCILAVACSPSPVANPAASHPPRPTPIRVTHAAVGRSLYMNRGIPGNDRQRRFTRICEPLRADLFRFTLWLSRSRSVAEDVVQETMLRAWKSLDSLKDDAAARHWLLTIAR